MCGCWCLIQFVSDHLSSTLIESENDKHRTTAAQMLFGWRIIPNTAASGAEAMLTFFKNANITAVLGIVR